jgi:glutaryl-CoA dehydrogenase (non-decarboxylating)
MDFRLSEEHLMVRETVRRFVENEIKPHIRDWDRHGADPKVYQRMADLGLLGICIPRKWGGSGLDYIALGIACEELEYGDTFPARGDVGACRLDGDDADGVGH